MSTQKAQQAEKTKKKLERVALRLFSKRGFDQVSIRDICQEAKVSVGTFYHYFDSKEHVFLERYTQQADELNRCFLEFETAPANRRVLELAGCYAKNVQEAGVDVIRVLYNPRSAAGREQGTLRQMFYRIVPDEQVVGMLLLAVQGVVYDWCKSDGDYDLREKMDGFLGVVMAGLQAQG